MNESALYIPGTTKPLLSGRHRCLALFLERARSSWRLSAFAAAYFLQNWHRNIFPMSPHPVRLRIGRHPLRRAKDIKGNFWRQILPLISAPTRCKNGFSEKNTPAAARCRRQQKNKHQPILHVPSQARARSLKDVPRSQADQYRDNLQPAMLTTSLGYSPTSASVGKRRQA